MTDITTTPRHSPATARRVTAPRAAGLAVAFSLLLALAAPAAWAAPLKVVTTLAPYAAIAREVGGDLVTVESIARGDEDGHFIKPKPSYALMLRDADLFVTTGLDLELWAPVLVDKSGNRGIRDGAPGYVSASQGVPLLEVPSSASRAAGDVHVYGNPHLFTSPLNAKIVAGNVAAGLKRVDGAHASQYDANLARFRQRIDEALYGKELVGLLGSERLDPLARKGELIGFLRGQSYEGKPLLDRLGGWLGEGMIFRGKDVVAYHKNWIYFTDLFGLHVVDYVEPKPGIPPSARHVHELIETMQQRGVKVILAASYFSQQQVETIAERTEARAVVVPLGPLDDGPHTYFDLVGLWVGDLADAFQATAG
jgi:ABC-type Zn uptake system ZnuABC Zn-binding protein ZnuA